MKKILVIMALCALGLQPQVDGAAAAMDSHSSLDTMNTVYALNAAKIMNISYESILPIIQNLDPGTQRSKVADLIAEGVQLRKQLESKHYTSISNTERRTDAEEKLRSKLNRIRRELRGEFGLLDADSMTIGLIRPTLVLALIVTACAWYDLNRDSLQSPDATSNESTEADESDLDDDEDSEDLDEVIEQDAAYKSLLRQYIANLTGEHADKMLTNKLFLPAALLATFCGSYFVLDRCQSLLEFVAKNCRFFQVKYN